MREVEFLPTWYPMLRRRRRLLVGQAWLTLLVACTAGAWVLVSQQSVSVAETSLSGLRQERSQNSDRLQELVKVQAMQRELAQQVEVVRKLGPRISTSVVMNLLDDLLPPNVSLLDLNIDGWRRNKNDPTATTRPDGWMGVNVHGVSPDDQSVGTFLARIAATRYVSDVAMTYLRDRNDNGRRMREFEITFAINPSGDER